MSHRLDFSKAFDTVEYPTVFKKLHNVGFSHDAIYWVFKYLTGRKQYFQINGKQSQVVGVQFGMPRGSILGPVLFNLYVFGTRFGMLMLPVCQRYDLIST